MNSTSPDIVLNSTRVIAYALVDETVTYNERGNFFVDGKSLGAVPKLAICQNLDEEDIMIFHCDNEWNVLGATGGNRTVEEAKEWALETMLGFVDALQPRVKELQLE